MKKKRMFAPQELWDPRAIELWLEDEAKKGWRVIKGSGWFWVFEKCEAMPCRVRVQYQGPMERNAWEERIATYEEMGWHLAVVLGQYYEIFYCDDPLAMEPDTDPEVYAMAWKAPLRRSWWGGWGVLLVFVIAFALITAEIWIERSVLKAFLQMSYRSLYVFFVLAPLALVMAIRQLLRVKRARQALEAGMVPIEGDWHKSRRWWRVCGGTLLAFWLVAWPADIFWITNDVDIEGCVTVRPVDLTNETDTKEWDFDVGGYVLRTAPLQPLWYRTVFQCENKTVENEWNDLRFECLAKALYRERTKEFLNDWPDATVENLETVCTEAILLTGGENEQMLLVRTGTLVYLLRTNYPADLRDAKVSIEDRFTAHQ